MNHLKWLLWPVSFVYALITRWRNHLYEVDYFKSFRFETNVISVGNLTVGGTGKTPMVEYLIRLLASDFKTAVLSRGYGRTSKGFQQGELGRSQVKDLGDEPYQYLLKYDSKVEVFVGEERALAIPNILYERPETQVILLDDAYQHRPVEPSLNILLTRYDRLFYKDHVMPVGRLREERNGASRADMVVVTKCKQELDQELVIKEMVTYLKSDEVPVFFTSVEYGQLVPFDRAPLPPLGEEEVVLISGIANADDLEQHVMEQFSLKTHLRFGDHHRYRKSDVQKIVEKSSGPKTIFVTTEKDFVKLREFKEELRDLPFYYLPIEIKFLNNKSKFDQLIRQSIRNYEVAQGEDE